MRKVRLLAAVGVLALIATIGALFVYSVTRQAVQLRVAGRSGDALENARVSLERGAYLYQGVARCAECHGTDLGGRFVLRSELVATLWGPNLTRGNPPVGSAYTDADFERAIRRGLRPSGMRLLMMPSWDYATMSDDDVSSVIAYVRTAKKVERDAPTFRLGVLGRMMLLTGRLGFDSDRIPDAVPERTALPAGAYLARLGGCLRCHGVAGPAPGIPIPFERGGEPLVTLGRLNVATFAAVLKTGRGPDGRAIAGHAAPARRWRDADIDALYRCFGRLGQNVSLAACSAPPVHAR
jgi:mono/diheme cytochrome c family protein